MKAGILFLGFLLAFLLESLPFGPLYAQLHPDFVALLILYWALSSEQALSYVVIWLIGLLQDLLLGDLLGAQAISLVLMLVLLYAWMNRVRRLPPWEQLFFIFFLLLAQQLAAWLWPLLLRPIAWHNALLIGPALGAALWPLLTYLLDQMQRHWPQLRR
ncbi:rod shape-determining protein MreD [Acidithiobacillus sp. AMEEHan]|uniref:rod shape-determining protein MreD n=1 Tax=Acidithiobacillus sp. AMEEHan TaxID=2994951 RepID=UPI0027E3CC4B|nr:rod shape-determining protein MreD [Acidithiobacillus sp. AMEEHan]